jgi:hypothetical protein
MVTGFGNNNAAAMVQPDNHTNIVLSNGACGAHGGSGLCSIGGTIRLGELLLNAPPIQYVLKLQLNAPEYYYNQPLGYVWPAIKCDSHAFILNCSSHYGGRDIYLLPGSLLAIPSNMTVNVTTVPSRKLLFTLKNYGGYICDNTEANRGTVDTEHGVTDEFQIAYGYHFDSNSPSPGAAWYADMLALFQSLRVVINNQNNTIGGGDIPLQPPPLPFCLM